jgi:hypothetical protein
MSKIFSGLLFSAMLSVIACEAIPATSETSAQVQQNEPLVSIPQTNDDDERIAVSQYRTDADQLIQGDYKIQRVEQVADFGAAEKHKIDFAVLKKGNRKILTFDQIGHPLETSVFGEAPFLGNGRKQVFIMQTAPRSGRFWIVDLTPKPKIIFDSLDFSVGREDWWIVDIDKDGTYEISIESIAFYPFENLSNSFLPLPEVVFKFDDDRGKYLPANHKFTEYSLRHLPRAVQTTDRLSKEETLGSVLGVLIAHVYAGQAENGWDFFDREYTFDDKEIIKDKIQKVFRKDPTYQFIYRDLQR